MKPFYIKDLKPDEAGRLEDRYLVKNADIRDGNNGKRHLYMTLADATGDIQAVKWSLTQDEIARYSKIRSGMIITVSGRCKEYQGKNQLVLDNIKGRAKDDTIDRADFFKAAPESPEAMYEYIKPQIVSMKKLASHGWFVRFLKITMPLKFKKTLGYGWSVEFPKCPSDTFAM